MGRKHIICEKWPIVAMVLTTPLAMVLTLIPEALGLGKVASNFASCIAAVGEALGLGKVASNLASCIVAVGILFLFKWWFSPKFKGVFTLRTSLAELGILLLPWVAKVAATLVAGWVDYGFYFNPTLMSLSMALAAGFVEETWFRGLAVPIGMGYLPKEKRVFTTVLVTSIIFGVIHVGNVFNGARIEVGVIQAIATTFAAFFFVAVFLRTGNILVPIALHAAWDYISFTTDPTVVNGIMMNEGISIGLMVAVAIEVAFGCAGLYLIRPAVHDKINRIWSEIWDG